MYAAHPAFPPVSVPGRLCRLLLLVLISGGFLLSGRDVCAMNRDSLPLIPAPAAWQAHGDTFNLAELDRIMICGHQDEVLDLAAVARDLLAPFTESEPEIAVVDSPGHDAGGLLIVLAEGFADEHYRLEIAGRGLILTASDPAGIFHGLGTLRQLAVNLDRGGGPVLVPTGVIDDGPRFAWRGMLLDCGRHFMELAVIKGLLDRLAVHKFNVFHWHLTEDQGWRLAVPGYPRLAEIGAWRQGPDGRPYGGFYTADDVREIVAYAAARFITVVPEIEMPGHARAALAAYPELSCSGGPFYVETQWGVHADVFCAGSEATFTFLENVLREVMDLFPSPFVHIGADEVPKNRWHACPRCQARIRTEGLAGEEELQSWFVARIERFLAAHGRRLIGWDEILDGDLAERESSAVVQAWRGLDRAEAAVAAGFAVIVSPTSHAYFDYDPGVLDLQQVHGFDPEPAGGAPTVNPGRILGGALNLWTEYIPAERIDTMLFPRLLGMAEALWSPRQRDAYPDFLDRVGRHQAVLASLDVRPGAAARPVTLTARTRNAGSVCRLGFTLDERVERVFAGHDLAVRWRLATEDERARFTPDARPEDQGLATVTTTDPVLADDHEVTISDEALVQARLFIDGIPYGAPALQEIVSHLAVGAGTDFRHPPSTRFGADPRAGLTDGLRGSRVFQDGRWYGSEGEGLEVAIDLGETAALTEVTVRFLQDANAWIFLPLGVQVQTSADGESWQDAGEAVHAVSDRVQEKTIREFTVPLEGRQAQFVRVTAVSPGICPAWHPGRRQPCWIFADEIVVR